MLLRPADGPKQIVCKDPATNAEETRRLSRYPAGHGEGYGGAFRGITLVGGAGTDFFFVRWASQITDLNRVTEVFVQA